MKRLFRVPFRSRAEVHTDVDEEFTFHLDMRTADLVQTGLSEREARAQAMREFGNRRASAKDCAHRSLRVERRRWMAYAAGTLRQDVAFAARLLVRNPAFTLVVVLTLALGIGANTAIFSVFEQVLLRPLPVSDPGALVNLGAPGPKPGSDSCNEAGSCQEVFSYPMFRDLQREQTPFTGIAAHRAILANIFFGQDRSASGYGMLVSGNYFRLLGLPPTLGRLIDVADDEVVGAGDVAVVSHEYWRVHLGEDPEVLGQTLVVNGRSLTIIGVAPQAFTGTTLGIRPMVFVPLSLAGQVQPGNDPGFENRRRYWLYLFARLRPGVSTEQASRLVNVPYRALLSEVEASLQEGMSEQTLARFNAKEVSVAAGSRGQSRLHTDVSMPVTLLLIVTGIVLLVACANIANLLLARSTARASEMAIRLSLGASRGQLVALLLTESSVLAVLGGAAGLLVAHWTLGGLTALLPQDGLTTVTVAVALDARAVIFALGVALATGLLFGLYPAWHSTRRDLLSSLKDRAGQPSGARAASRFRASLVTAQIALATALLVAAGLFTRSLVNVARVDLGLQAEQLVTFGLLPALNGYEPKRAHALFERLELELAALPGVTSATASAMPMLSSATSGGNVRVQGFDAGPDTDTNTRYNAVGTDFFRTMGMTLVAGRSFTEADAPSAPRVVIVNQAFARKFTLGPNPIGRRMADWTSPDAAEGSGDGLDMEIVGVVEDTPYSEVKQAPPPLFYRAYRQDEPSGAMVFYVRTSGAVEPLLGAIPGVVASLDPQLPVEMLRTMPQQVRENVYLDRMVGLLSAAFAALATLLAAVGLYGMLAYTIGQRTREIGLRMALGADASHVRAMVLGHVARLTALGVLAGVVAALAAGRTAQSLLFGLESHDPLTVVTAVVLLSAVALVAGFIPAHRASKIEPMRALRYD